MTEKPIPSIQYKGQMIEFNQAAEEWFWSTFSSSDIAKIKGQIDARERLDSLKNWESAHSRIDRLDELVGYNSSRDICERITKLEAIASRTVADFRTLQDGAVRRLQILETQIDTIERVVDMIRIGLETWPDGWKMIRDAFFVHDRKAAK